MCLTARSRPQVTQTPAETAQSVGFRVEIRVAKRDFIGCCCCFLSWKVCEHCGLFRRMHHG